MPKRIEGEARIQASTGKLEDYPLVKMLNQRLENLKPKLDEAQRIRDLLVARARSGVKRLCNQSTAVMPRWVNESVLDDMASKVAAAGDIPVDLANRLQHTALQVQADDTNDTEELEQIRQAERRLMLLKRAVVFTERAMTKARTEAIAELIGPVQTEREKIARKTAEAVLALASRLAEEDAFIETVRSSSDGALLDSLRPGIFPITLQDPAVCRWIAAALGISEDEAQSRIASSSRAVAAMR